MLGLELHGLSGVGIGVIAALGVMSVVSVAVIVDRWRALRRTGRESRAYAAALRPLLASGRLQDAREGARLAAYRHAHLARLVDAGLQEWQLQSLGEPDLDSAALATREALRQTAILCLEEMRSGLALLASIGATAPFIGLFGTTFGIIKAFADIAAVGAGGITVVAGGVSEALVTTAVGLFVAIPAVWAYNACLRRIEGVGIELERAGYELVRRLRRPAAPAAA